MRQIFENVWEVDIRGKNMWFQRKSRTAEKIPKDNSTDSTGMSNVCQTLRRSSKCFQTRCSLKCSSKDDVCTKGNDRTSKHLGWSLVFLAFSPTSLCGVLVFGCALPPASSCLPPPPTLNLLTHNLPAHNLSTHTTCSHTTCSQHNLLTHNFSHTHSLPTHNLLAHNLLTKLNHTHNLSTHNLFTHHILTHHILTHNLPTHNWLTHNLLTPTCQHTTYSHTACSHTTCPHTHLTRTQLTMLTHDLTTHNLATSTFTSRGRRGTWRHRPSLCVSSTCILRGRCASLCVAGVVLGDIDLHFAWQARHSCRRVHATVTNPALITHLLRTVIANSDVECIWRAQTPTIRWHEECIFIKIHTRIITVHVDHTKQQQ